MRLPIYNNRYVKLPLDLRSRNTFRYYYFHQTLGYVLCIPTTVLHMHELQAAFNVRLIVEYFMATKTIMQEEDQFVL